MDIEGWCVVTLFDHKAELKPCVFDKGTGLVKVVEGRSVLGYEALYSCFGTEIEALRFAISRTIECQEISLRRAREADFARRTHRERLDYLLKSDKQHAH